MNLKNVKAGDTIWVVRIEARSEEDGRPYSVTKVGRDYVHVSAYTRFHIDTGLVTSGNMSPTLVAYPSRSQFVDEFLTQKAWTDFMLAIRNTYKVPEGLTTEKIKEAATLLGFSI